MKSGYVHSAVEVVVPAVVVPMVGLRSLWFLISISCTFSIDFEDYLIS